MASHLSRQEAGRRGAEARWGKAHRTTTRSTARTSHHSTGMSRQEAGRLGAEARWGREHSRTHSTTAHARTHARGNTALLEREEERHDLRRSRGRDTELRTHSPYSSRRHAERATHSSRTTSTSPRTTHSSSRTTSTSSRRRPSERFRRFHENNE